MWISTPEFGLHNATLVKSFFVDKISCVVPNSKYALYADNAYVVDGSESYCNDVLQDIVSALEDGRIDVFHVYPEGKSGGKCNE